MDSHTEERRLSSENGEIRLKANELFLVCDEHGDIATDDAANGLYWRGTRFLRRLNMLVDGRPTEDLSHAVSDDGTTCSFDVAILSENEQQGIDGGQRDIHLNRRIELSASSFKETLTFTSYRTGSVALTVRLALGADFKDIFEVRGLRSVGRGAFQPPELAAGAMSLFYLGRDNVLRAARVTVSPDADADSVKQELTEENADVSVTGQWTLRLRRLESTTISVVVNVWEGNPSTPPEQRWRGDEAIQRQPLRVRPLPTLVSDNTSFNRTLLRGMHDLEMMCVRTPAGFFPYGGIPWYVCPFGRDSLITSLEFLPWFPEVARGTLAFLAARQGQKEDSFTEEQPGRILHELRVGELANLREIPFIPYYGAVDATPLFIITLEQYIRWTNDTELLRQLWPHALAAARWIVDYGDSDGDGFLDYQRSEATGLVNQGWKDSWDAISHTDGSLAQGHVALCEAQGYAYAAFQAMAWLAAQSGHGDQSQPWSQRAAELQQRFSERFWWPEQQCYYLALDGASEPCRVVSSNAGQCLWSGIATQAQAQAIVERLLRPDMYTEWGIRTLSSDAARFNPMSYHNGSVWPHDTALIGAGFARYGFREQAARLLGNLYGVSLHYEGARLPELFCGFARTPGFGPTRYPVACAPQSWAAGAPFLLMQALLGFEPDATQGRLTLRRPLLPGWLSRLEMREVRVGDLSGQLRFERSGDEAAVRLSHGSEIDIQVAP